MMEQRAVEFNQAKGRMANDIRTIITDGEDFLRAAANVSSAGWAAARGKFEEKLTSARAKLVDASQPAVDKARRTAAAANDYVHGSPWTMIGVGAAAGALIGFRAAKR